ncbi:BON1-associated protein 2 [Brachypodium distachyon]|nr:BON1-associated protein 2 [Brachypodium distachyon]|eukprot:XP_003576757.1 BON1-associated protein 2 [Brachypodium distachyon]
MAAPCKGAAKLPPFMAESFAWETTVEVTVVSAEEVVLGGSGALRRRPLSGGAYAAVHTMSSAARTRVDDEDGGDCNGYPYWGEAVRVKVPAWSSAIDVEICRTRGDGRVESVASARVPVADFGVGPPGHLHCLSYRLFDSGSRMTSRNGVVNIRVKRLDGCAPPGAIEGKLAGNGKAAVDGDCGTSGGSGGGSCCGVNVAEQGKVQSAPAGVVMGFPVGYSADGQASGKGTV